VAKSLTLLLLIKFAALQHPRNSIEKYKERTSVICKKNYASWRTQRENYVGRRFVGSRIRLM